MDKAEDWSEASKFDIRNYDDEDEDEIPYVIWLNKKEVREMLNIPGDYEQVDCNDDVYEAMFGDYAENVGHLFDYLIKNVKVLVYFGMDDADCSLSQGNTFINTI